MWNLKFTTTCSNLRGSGYWNLSVSYESHGKDVTGE